MESSKPFNEVVLPNEPCGLFNAVLTDGNRVTAVQFDPCHELLWTGNSLGRVTLFYGSAMEKYTSFQMFPSTEVRGFLSLDGNVVAISRDAVKCNSKGGLCISSLSTPEFHDLQCILINLRSSDDAYLGGLQPFVNVLNLRRMELVRKIPIPDADCVLLKGNENLIYSATSKGQIIVRDWRTFDVVELVKCYNGTLSDFDIHQNKFVTCGFSKRNEQLTCDLCVNTYDLRNFQLIKAVPLTFEPFFVRFFNSGNCVIVVSQHGQFLTVDLNDLKCGYSYQLDTQGTACHSFDVSPNFQCAAFGDGSGGVHLYSDNAEPAFLEAPKPVEFPTETVPLVNIPFDDYSAPPLSAIPVPLPENGRRLSDWNV